MDFLDWTRVASLVNDNNAMLLDDYRQFHNVLPCVRDVSCDSLRWYKTRLY